MSNKKQTSIDSFLKGKRKPKDVVESKAKKDKNSATKKTPSASKKSIEDTKHEEEKVSTIIKKGDPNSNPLDSYDDFVSQLGDWQEPLKDYLKTSHFKSIFEYVKREYDTTTCYPPKELIFNAFKKAPFNDIKVVIVGQDPYIKENEAMGL
jgi:hypothetical protein